LTNVLSHHPLGLHVKRVTVHAAKTHLSRLLKAAEAGEEVVITRGRTPVARLVPILDAAPTRRFGAMRGRATVTDAFFEPMTEEELALWYGGPL
jgi:prevent-host-death family protein